MNDLEEVVETLKNALLSQYPFADSIKFDLDEIEKGLLCWKTHELRFEEEFHKGMSLNIYAKIYCTNCNRWFSYANLLVRDRKKKGKHEVEIIWEKGKKVTRKEKEEVVVE